jgi:hypothetical protein
VLGGRVVANGSAALLIVDRRYESDRFHGTRRVGDCDVADGDTLQLLDPTLPPPTADGARTMPHAVRRPRDDGLSGGAGTVAFLVGCGWFDMGAFQVRQFLLTSYASERALLVRRRRVLRRDVAARHLQRQDVRRAGDGDALAVPPHAAAARVGAALRHAASGAAAVARRATETREGRGEARGGCRLGTLERVLCDVHARRRRPGMDIPARYFRFLRSGDARPLEPVLEHNRLDLISLAAVSRARGAARREGTAAAATPPKRSRSARSTSAPDAVDRAHRGLRARGRRSVRARSTSCWKRSTGWAAPAARPRYAEAADCWRRLLDVKQGRFGRGSELLAPLRQYAVEALAIHHEHRVAGLRGSEGS